MVVGLKKVAREAIEKFPITTANFAEVLREKQLSGLQLGSKGSVFRRKQNFLSASMLIAVRITNVPCQNLHKNMIRKKMFLLKTDPYTLDKQH